MKNDKLRDFIAVTLMLSMLSLTTPTTVIAKDKDNNEVDTSTVLLDRYNDERGKLLTVKNNLVDSENNAILEVITDNDSYLKEKPLGSFSSLEETLKTSKETIDVKYNVTINYYLDRKEEKVIRSVNLKNDSEEKYTCFIYNLDGSLYAIYKVK